LGAFTGIGRGKGKGIGGAPTPCAMPSNEPPDCIGAIGMGAGKRAAGIGRVSAMRCS
jgi:hypothetical protein